MTFRTGKRRISSSDRRPDAAFTLVELILVMALLTIVISVGAPSLARFFRGRSLDSEAHRFLSLTHYGQSRAVSEGVPMILWIDAQQGLYGLRAETGYVDEDRKAVEFSLDDKLQLEVEASPARPLFSQRNRPLERGNRLPEIRLTPDGFIADTSPEAVAIREGKEEPIWIGQSRNRLHYEVQTNHVRALRR
jgi:type II secretion system protein H